MPSIEIHILTARGLQISVEDSIAQKEITYLDSTPSGNIITGFDNYMKGTSGAAAQRRKVGPAEQNRVFSRSSISYKPNTAVSLDAHPGGRDLLPLLPMLTPLRATGDTRLYTGFSRPDTDLRVIP